MTQQRINNNNIELFTDSKETAELIQAEFSCLEPGHEHSMEYRMGKWNGKKNFYQIKKMDQGWVFTLPEGFKGRVEHFTDEKFPAQSDYSEALEYLKLIKKELPFEPYRHQQKMFLGLGDAVSQLGVACTGSGKSLVLYMLSRYKRHQNKKILILVPIIDLVTQLYDDFVDYKAPDYFMDDIQQIGGEFKNKNIHKNLVISTWQSAHKADLSRFDVILNDEVHLSKNDTITQILTNPFAQKIGLTGTVPVIEMDAMLLEQNFGYPVTYIKARELIDLGMATDLVVVPIFLSQKHKIMKYQDEMTFRKTDPKRQRWVNTFLYKMKGLSIALYNHTEHGKDTWKNYTKETASPKNLNDFELQKKHGCFFMSGSSKIRKQILAYLDTLDNYSNVIVIGQVKLLSTGINIKALKNLIFLSPGKSYTEVIQSIGRVLRLHDSKNKAVVFDLVDDYSKGRKTENYSLTYFFNRLTFYEFQDFKINEVEIDITNE